MCGDQHDGDSGMQDAGWKKMFDKGSWNRKSYELGPFHVLLEILARTYGVGLSTLCSAWVAHLHRSVTKCSNSCPGPSQFKSLGLRQNVEQYRLESARDPLSVLSSRSVSPEKLP